MNEDTPVLPIDNLDPSLLKEMDLALISLQNASAKERKNLITALEQQVVKRVNVRRFLS